MSALQSEYETWLANLQLRHFAPAEVTNYGKAGRNGVTNSLPAKELWINIVRPLWVLDQLRAHIDKPIRLTSLYRSPEYNRKGVNGSTNSFHTKNAAIDFQVIGMSPGHVFDKLNRMRHAGSWTGGLGAYPTFTHIAAGLRSRNATW